MEAASEPLAGSVRQKAAMCSPGKPHTHITINVTIVSYTGKSSYKAIKH